MSDDGLRTAAKDMMSATEKIHRMAVDEVRLSEHLMELLAAMLQRGDTYRARAQCLLRKVRKVRAEETQLFQDDWKTINSIAATCRTRWAERDAAQARAAENGLRAEAAEADAAQQLALLGNVLDFIGSDGVVDLSFEDRRYELCRDIRARIAARPQAAAPPPEPPLTGAGESAG